MEHLKKLPEWLGIIALSAVLCVFAVSCNEKEEPYYSGTFEKTGIVCMFSHNNLHGYSANDLDDIKKGYLPSLHEAKAMFVFAHISLDNSGTNPQDAYLIRLSKEGDGNAKCDTVYTIKGGSAINTTGNIRDMLSWLKENYPSKSYGMTVSSHGTGWLPEGYYRNPEASSTLWGICDTANEEPLDGYALPGPPVKTISEDINKNAVTEMDVKDFAESIPMHFEYIMLDCCLMGGIETAYQLKDKTDYIGFSQCEIGADGFDYSRIASRMLNSGTKAYQAIADDYFAICKDNIYGGTISIVQTSGLDKLAKACKTIFDENREKIEEVNPNNVQGFFRYNRHYFYDMQDILTQAGIDDEAMEGFREALGNVVISCSYTDKFLEGYGGFNIRTDCGLSMYLPCDGTSKLNNYYKLYDWNYASGLVN